MPYILKSLRPQYEPYITGVLETIYALSGQQDDSNLMRLTDSVNELVSKMENVGDLNYVISSLIWRQFEANETYTFGNHLIDVLEDVSDNLNTVDPVTENPFARVVINLCRKAYEERGIRDIKGVLRCASLEFYRRRLALYEDKKIADPKNGDLP